MPLQGVKHCVQYHLGNLTTALDDVIAVDKHLGFDNGYDAF